MRRSSEFAHGVQGRLMLIDVDLPLIARSVRLYPIPAVDLGWPVPARGPNSPTPRKKKKQVRVWWKQVLLVLHHCSNVSQAVQQDPCLSTLLLRVAFKLCYPVVILVKTWTQKSTKICILRICFQTHLKKREGWQSHSRKGCECKDWQVFPALSCSTAFAA